MKIGPDKYLPRRKRNQYCHHEKMQGIHVQPSGSGNAECKKK
jgi:hypothetical protein